MTRSRSALTRDAILDAAEHLFAAQGHDNTSMRQITRAAQVNLSAVNYHFGTKNALVQAVFQRRLDALNDERLRMLDALEARTGQQPLQAAALIDAYFGPLVRHACSAGAERRAFVPLQTATMSDPTGTLRALFTAERSAVAQRFTQALLTALPGMPEAEIVWRFHFMLGATAYAIMGADGSSHDPDQARAPGHDGDDPDRDPGHSAQNLLRRLTSFLLGGLQAPLSSIHPLSGPAS